MRTDVTLRAAFVAALLAVGAPLPLVAQQPARPAAISGIAYDSVRGRPMSGAQIAMRGTAMITVAGPDGSFHFDSVPPGKYQLITAHPILDSIGVQLVTPVITIAAGEQKTLNITTPSPASLVKMLCPAAWLTRGPSALFGRVRNADTEEPMPKAQVSIVWSEFDLSGLRKIPRLREAVTGPDGTYRICGLPATFNGKVQATFGGVKSGDVPVTFDKDLLELRSMSIAAAAPATVAAGDTNHQPPRPAMNAQLVGRVLNGSGKPVHGARVQLEGTLHSVNTGPDGSFKLDSLPSGSQVVRAMLIGYTPTEKAVELSSIAPASVSLELDNSVMVLPTVTTEVQRISGLDAVGFTERRKSGFGYFMDEKAIDNRQAPKFTDLLRTVPGLSVTTSGYDTYITDTRSPGGGGCVDYVVDGSPWSSMSPGDVNGFLTPDQVGAIEVYHGSETPAQFQIAGQTGCATIVAWTKWWLQRHTKK